MLDFFPSGSRYEKGSSGKKLRGFIGHIHIQRDRESFGNFRLINENLIKFSLLLSFNLLLFFLRDFIVKNS